VATIPNNSKKMNENEKENEHAFKRHLSIGSIKPNPAKYSAKPSRFVKHETEMADAVAFCTLEYPIYLGHSLAVSSKDTNEEEEEEERLYDRYKLCLLVDVFIAWLERELLNELRFGRAGGNGSSSSTTTNTATSSSSSSNSDGGLTYSVSVSTTDFYSLPLTRSADKLEVILQISLQCDPKMVDQCYDGILKVLARFAKGPPKQEDIDVAIKGHLIQQAERRESNQYWLGLLESTCYSPRFKGDVEAFIRRDIHTQDTACLNLTSEDLWRRICVAMNIPATATTTTGGAREELNEEEMAAFKKALHHNFVALVPRSQMSIATKSAIGLSLTAVLLLGAFAFLRSRRK